MTAPVLELDVEGPGAPPRSNGELVFAEPWEGRAFGLVMALSDAEVVRYDDFRARLISQVATWEAAHPGGVGYSYYRCWLQALEQLLVEQELVSSADVDVRSAAFAGRPQGHDHDHDHDHDH